MDKQAQTVVLRRVGQFLQVSPPCQELRLALRTSVHVPRPMGHGIAIGCEPGPLYRETTDLDKPVLECFVGLLPVVEKVLTTAGYKGEMDFATPPPLSPANEAAVKGLGACDTLFLDMIRFRDRGLVRYVPACVEPAWLIAQVALAWPNLSIAVATTRVNEARQLRRRLSRYLPGVAAITSRDRAADENVGRVVVATYNGLGHSGVEIEKRDIVIALNAAEASQVEPLSRLGHARRARMYGLIPLDRKVAQNDEDVVRLLFGFEEVTIQRHGVPTTQIEVVQFSIFGWIRFRKRARVTALKRLGVWSNELRNRRIAWLANQLIGDDHSEVQQAHPVLGTALQGRSRLAVLVLVENIEHGNALASHLPGWPFVAAGQPRLAAEVKRASDLRPFVPMPPDKRPMYAIATWQGVQLLNAGGWDVVIRADGGVGLPPFLEQVTGAPIIYGINNPAGQPPPRLLLVDFNDKQNQLLRRCSRQRWKEYAQQGWYPPGVDPLQARVDQFLATRPGIGDPIQAGGVLRPPS